MALGRMSNVILRVSDLDRSLAFYRDVLAMRVLGTGGAFAFLDGEGVTLALNATGDPYPDNCRLTEVLFEVPDVAAEYAALREAGVEFRVEPRVVMAAGDRPLLAADFSDPDGHVLSITGWEGV